MRLNKKELSKIEAQLTIARRGETWVGIRPCVMESKKYSKKHMRREGKALCREYF